MAGRLGIDFLMSYVRRQLSELVNVEEPAWWPLVQDWIVTFAALTIPVPVALTTPGVVRTWLSPWIRLTEVMLLG